MMATKLFISYRRDDSAGHAGRVHDRLEREFGRDLLFMDVDAIPLGVNFVKVLGEEVAKCDVLLAVIGPNWLNARDEDGNRRLDNPHDFVRIEIGAALQRNIPVIPILLDGTKVPKGNQLPKELEELSLRNGLDIHHVSFHNDVDRLIRSLKGLLAKANAEKRRGDEDERRTQEAEFKQRAGEEERRRKAEAWERRRDEQERRQEEAEGARPFLANAAARSIAPGRWRMAAGSAIALLLAGWIGVYQMGVPVWVPWTPRAEQPDAPGADKAKAAAEAEARAKAEQAEKERLAAAKAEEDRKAQAAADAEAKRKSAEAEQQRLAARADIATPAAGKSAAPTEPRLHTESPPPTDRLIRTFAESGGGLSVAFSPDGRTALSGSHKSVKLWEVATGKELLTFTGHSNSVNSVAFAPDGRTALSGSDDSTLKLWDVASGKEIRTFTGHSNGGLSVAFSPDGRKTFTFSRQRKVFALSASDKSVMLWDLTGLEPPAARAGR